VTALACSKRRRGRPPKQFGTDPDRYVIAMVDGLRLANPKNKLNQLIAFAIYFMRGEQVSLPDNPAKMARRLKIGDENVGRLNAGWKMQTWGIRTDTIDSEISRIAKKMKRLERDVEAQNWRDYVGTAWAVFFGQRRRDDLGDQERAEAADAKAHQDLQIITQFLTRAGELPVLQDQMLRLAGKFVPPTGQH